MIIPGRILVIDNSPDEVNQLVETLKAEGENVFYFMSLPDKKVLENVRLLILDLIVDPADEETSYEMVAGMIKETSEVSGFVVVALWTKAAKNNLALDSQILAKIKGLLVGSGFKGVLLDPFGKDGITQKELFTKLKGIVNSDPQCSLLLEIERAIETARDRTVSEILNVGSVPLFLKVLREEVGEAALSREALGLYLKILTRHSKITSEISASVLQAIGENIPIDDEKYGQMYNLQSYYETCSDERLWTGDILENNGEYAVIISSACDFAQSKERSLDYIKIIHAFRINHKDLIDKEKKKEICTKLKPRIESREACIRAILTGGKYLQKRFYVLKYMKDSADKALYHLVLDFQQVGKLPFRNTKTELQSDGWKTSCRIDNPIMQDLLHEYSAYASRIGVQSIPIDVVEKLVERTRE